MIFTFLSFLIYVFMFEDDNNGKTLSKEEIKKEMKKLEKQLKKKNLKIITEAKK